jgi:hypothetical protein
MALTRIGLNQSINLASNVTGTLPAANGGTGATSFTAGKVLQAVSSVQSFGGEETTTSTSFTGTSTTATITPSATSSKILILATGNSKYNGTEDARFTIYRDSTDLQQTSNGRGFAHNFALNGISTTLNYLDAPSSTSALVYKVYFRVTADGTVTWNSYTSTSSMILFEIAG